MFNQNELKSMYNLAVRKFVTGNYDSAKQMFWMLILNEPDNILYNKSYVGCIHAAKQLEDALAQYYALYKSDNKRYLDCLYYAAVVAFESKRYPIALEYFNEFMQNVGSNMKLHKLKVRAKSYLKMVNSVLSQKTK